MLKPLVWAFLLFAPHLAAAPTVDTAFARIYSFDFASGRAFARAYTALHDSDPLGHAVVALIKA